MLQVSEKEVKERLAFDNPWWQSGAIDPRYQGLPRRAYLDSFFKLVQGSGVQRAVILMGPRRVGKTVLVHHAIDRLLTQGIAGKAILYLSLDTPLYTGWRLERLVQLFRELRGSDRPDRLWVFFDEIQYLRDWEVHLKSLVDSFPAIQFVATGSAAAALRLKSHESGAGRFTDYMLPPLTFAEYLAFIKRESELIEADDSAFRAKNIAALNTEFINYLNYGGYPEAVFAPGIQSDPARYIKNDIVDKVLLRDLPSLYGIQDIQELNRLFTTIAYNTGQEVSLEALSQSSGVVKNTIRRYLEYLEAAFLIRLVHRIDQDARHFQRATTFKVYLTNPSIRGALFGPVSAEHACMGALVETAIFAQWVHDRVFVENIHYARWKTGEVDIVALNAANQRPMWCAEVKWSDRPVDQPRELEALISFVRGNGLDSNPLVTSFSRHTILTVGGVTIEVKPSSVYCYTVGKNILRRR